ncbi:hypothetical protein D3C72_329020 [compost metagenome]
MDFNTVTGFILSELVPLIQQVSGVRAVYTRPDEVNRFTGQRGLRIRVVVEQRNFALTSGAVHAIYTALTQLDSTPIPPQSSCLDIEICRDAAAFDALTAGVGWDLALAEA